MVWQLALVALAVTAAVLYLLRAAWRNWSGAKAGCGGGCCAKSPPERSVLIPSKDLTLRKPSHR
jgi:hypothetical protein